MSVNNNKTLEWISDGMLLDVKAIEIHFTYHLECLGGKILYHQWHANISTSN